MLHKLNTLRGMTLLVLAGLTLSQCSAQPSTTKPTNSNSSTPTAAYKAANEGWIVDLDEAYKLSQKEGKPIMANFTGSDWCGWCKRLDAAVFSTDEFKSWAKKNVVLLEVDFPRRFQIPEKNRNQNYAMQNALQVTGYPTVWLFNLEKNADTGQYHIDALGKTGYSPSVAEFTGTVDKILKQM